MRRLWWLWVAGFWVTGLAGWAAAQEPAASSQVPDPRESPTTLLSSSPMPGLSMPVREFPGHVTVLTAKEIRASGASSIPELLSRLAGVHVLDTNGFGLGADTGVNLRGVVNGSRTGALVLLDGVRQNRVTGDEVHWASIPLEQVERIEIIRGGGSVIYGEGALSGVIAITTKKAAEQPLQLESAGELGSYGQRKVGLSVRSRIGVFGVGAGYHRRDVTGYRESTNSRATVVTSHAACDPWPAIHIETNVLHSEDVSGFAGGITPEASEARRRQRGSFAGFFDEEISQVAIDTLVRGPQGLASGVGAFWRWRESDAVVGGRFATITPSQGLHLRTSHHAEAGAVGHTLISGLELTDEKASTGTRGGGFSESNKQAYGLFVEETLRLFNRASVVAGLRYDKARYEEDISFPAFVGTLRFEGWSPKVGASVDVWGPVSVYADYSRPFKAPQVDDFSAVVPTGFVGNIDLQPQQADNYELGIRADDERIGHVEAHWFYMRTNDEILFNDFADQNQNFDTIRTGVELVATPKLPVPNLASQLTYTITEAEFRKGAFNDRKIPGTPEHRVTASVSYELVPRLFLTSDWLLVRNFFRINDFTNSLPGDKYGVLNLGVRYQWEAASLYAKIENVTNEEYTTFQSSDGSTVSTGENPAPPISVLGGFSVVF
ncbi:MAG: TonB-dependent receptor [Candidatus Omnitrophica bacterium]|nr:TonB-dependent receptor [Candidatus Omnitrophota bacterium]